jgi:hypothetical protein
MKRIRFVLVGLFCLGLLLSCTGSGSSPTYKVTYDANGARTGSVPVDDSSYEQGDVVTVLGNSGTLSKRAPLYDGWNTQADGTGTTYQAGQTFTMGAANVTLYVKWL